MAATIAYDPESYPELVKGNHQFTLIKFTNFIVIKVPEDYRMKFKKSYDMSFIAEFCEAILDIKLPTYLSNRHNNTDLMYLIYYKNTIGYVTKTHFDEFTRYVDNIDNFQYDRVIGIEFPRKLMMSNAQDLEGMEWYYFMHHLDITKPRHIPTMYESFIFYTYELLKIRKNFNKTLTNELAKLDIIHSDTFTSIREVTYCIDTKPVRIIPLV